MDYTITEDSKIIINDLTEFDPKHIFECGQVFRYRSNESGYKVFTKNLKCSLIYGNAHVIIDSSDVGYFQNYFDLDADYGEIKKRLSGYPKLADALAFGKGIRILRQDPIEMIISFIISANNNIPRIQKIIERLCNELGENMGDYYSFPCLEALAAQNEDFYASIGAGYRARYLSVASRMLLEGYADDISSLSTAQARKKLLGILGVGGKVADCILLFGYHKADVFPVDVWSERVYNMLYGDDGKDRKYKSKRLTDEFGELSGYAQQYLFYYARENQITNHSKMEEEK